MKPANPAFALAESMIAGVEKRMPTIRGVTTVTCPRCHGGGFTAGAMSYGSNIEACERCSRCDGRGVVTSEIFRAAK